METGQQPLLLMLGADRYAMQACVRLGIETVVVCGPGVLDDGLVEIPPSLTLVRVDTQSSAEAILMALHRAGYADRGFDGVQTTDEWSLVVASLLAGYLGCDFLDPATAVRFRDKSLQKARVAAAGVQAAAVTVIEDVYDVSGIRELPYSKAVLKPIAGAATVRTSVVSGIEELRRLSAQYREQRIPQRTFALEEYVPGEEWIADGIMFDGEIVFWALGHYGEPCLSTVLDGSALSILRFDPESDEWAYARALPTVRASLEALGLRSGVFHMELFHDPKTGELTFSECAARRGGGLVHEDLQAKFNVHLSESAVLCALGRRPEPDIKLDRRAIGSAFLLGRPGTLISCPSPAEIVDRPGVLFARVERPYGTVVDGTLGSTNTRTGQFLAAAEDLESLQACHTGIQEWFARNTTVIPSGTTGRDLREWQRETWEDADFGDTLWG